MLVPPAIPAWLEADHDRLSGRVLREPEAGAIQAPVEIPADRGAVFVVSLDVHTERVYEPVERGDGYRVLTGHIWPRGVSKERAKLDE
jgi:hypothetical protein